MRWRERRQMRMETEQGGRHRDMRQDMKSSMPFPPFSRPFSSPSCSSHSKAPKSPASQVSPTPASSPPAPSSALKSQRGKSRVWCGKEVFTEKLLSKRQARQLARRKLWLLQRSVLLSLRVYVLPSSPLHGGKPC